MLFTPFFAFSNYALLLTILSRWTTATPQATSSAIPSETVSAQSATGTGHVKDTIRLSSGVVAAIVVGVVAVVALSIICCCPCWNWPSRTAIRKRRLPGPIEPSKLDRGLYRGAEISELGLHEVATRSELHGDDIPPTYASIERETRANARGQIPELDTKGGISPTQAPETSD